jgi:hypothetical protein
VANGVENVKSTPLGAHEHESVECVGCFVRCGLCLR